MAKINIITTETIFKGKTNALVATKSTAVENVTATAPAQITPQTVTTIEEAQATINILVNAINDLRVLSEANKTQLNAKLTADRASGQQAIQ